MRPGWEGWGSLQRTGLGLVRGGAALLLLLAIPSRLSPQAAGVGIQVQHYSFGDPGAVGIEGYTLTTAPFAVSVPVGSWFTFEASSATAKGVAKAPSGEEVQLSGLTDTQIGISVPVGRDRAIVTFGATLPTGQTTLTLEEAAVAGIVAAELLPFAITTWGAGGGGGADLALAFAGGGWGFGVSGGYRTGREFEPLEAGEFSFRPGDQIRFRVAVDREVGEAGTLSLLVGAQRFGEDQLEGTNLFRAGTRVEGLVSYAFPLGLRGSALLYGSVLHRGAGTLLLRESALEGARSAPTQDLFMGGGSFRLPAGRQVVFLPEAQMRVFRAEDGVSQGWIGTVGTGAELRVAGRSLGPRMVLAPSIRIRFGGVTVQEEATTGISGWEVGLAIRGETGR